ncbi:hypothetical protein QQ045_027442 [Rhodiola kirilowii]
MGNEEQTGNTSNSVCFRNGGNGKQSRKPKPKKIPQRGLGVAQLEKLRLEEQVKNEAVSLPSSAFTPLPATSLCNGSSPFAYSNENLYGLHPNVRQQSTLLSSEYIREVEKSTRSLQNPIPPFEPIASSPFGGLMQLGNQQPSFITSSMVNVVAVNSSSAVLSFQTEPPSNQSPYGTYRSVQLDEAEKVYAKVSTVLFLFFGFNNETENCLIYDAMQTVGTKRPCPFSLQEPSDLSPQCKFNSFTTESLGKSTSYSNAGSLVIKGNPSTRDGLPRSMSTPHMNDIRADKTRPDGDFLKLAPPATLSLLPSAKSKEALSHLHTNHDEEDSNISVQQQQSFYSFFPAPNTSRYNCETEEHIDLNLKL